MTDPDYTVESTREGETLPLGAAPTFPLIDLLARIFSASALLKGRGLLPEDDDESSGLLPEGNDSPWICAPVCQLGAFGM